MNIDIASIDMVSEVNMVSVDVYDYFFADFCLGTGRRNEPAIGGGGVPGYVYGGGEGVEFHPRIPSVEVRELALSGP